MIVFFADSPKENHFRLIRLHLGDFCGKFIDRRSRTVYQMVQGARSVRQNIAEAYRGESGKSG